MMAMELFVFMLTFMGTQHLVPASEFRVANPIFDPNCPPFHLHAKVNDQVTALDDTVIPDPDPTVCGYGLLGVIPAAVYIGSDFLDSDFDGIPDFSDPAPNDPDSNDNGQSTRSKTATGSTTRPS